LTDQFLDHPDTGAVLDESVVRLALVRRWAGIAGHIVVAWVITTSAPALIQAVSCYAVDIL